MAYSGRCLLSGYINKRDPNQGTCTNACRWKYNVQEAETDSAGNIIPQVVSIAPTLGEGATTDSLFLLEEPQRPGELMPAFEDEHGTYIMNSKDLRAVQHVEQLTQLGVHSLKIEGRTKSYYYCARTAQVYRKAIDAAAKGELFDPNLLKMLDSLAHRGYTEGFLRRHTHDEYQNYGHSYSASDYQQFVGEFTGKKLQEWAEILVKNRFQVGDRVEMMTPQGNIHFNIEAIRSDKGKEMDVAPGVGYIVYIMIPDDMEVEYALLMRHLNHGTTRNPD